MSRRVYQVDHPVEDDTPARPPVLARIMAGVGLIPWVVCGLAVLGVGGWFVLTMGGAENVLQQAAVSATAAAAVVGCYALARCAEKVLSGLGKVLGKG